MVSQTDRLKLSPLHAQIDCSATATLLTLPHLRRSNGPPHPSAPLPRVQPRLLALHRLRGLLDDLLALGQDHFDVARVRHIGVDLCVPSAPSLSTHIPQRRSLSYSGGVGRITYAAVSPVRPAPLLGRLVDLDVFDDQVRRVQTLCVGVGLGVLEQVDEEGAGLLRPAGLCDAELLACVRDRTNQP